MNYALIEGGVVINIIWLSASNLRDFPDAINTGGLPVRVGDAYENGVFYRDGEKLLTEAERAAAEAIAAQAAYEQGVQEA